MNNTPVVSDQVVMFNVGTLPGADKIITFLTSLSVLGIVKTGVIIGLAMYCIFALIIIKQVGIMKESFDDDANSAIGLIAWGHLFLTVALLVLVVVFF